MACSSRVVAAGLAVLAALAVSSLAAEINIVGGKEARTGEHLYVASLHLSSECPESMCMATLINRKFLLTTATCAKRKPTWAVMASHYSRATGHDHGGREVIATTIYPGFDPKTLVFDFAVLELSSIVGNVPLAQINWSPAEEKPKQAMVRGFGASVRGGPMANVLNEAVVMIWEQSSCINFFGNAKILESMMCAGGDGRTDACDGDTGAPLTVSRNGVEELVGIFSWATWPYSCVNRQFAGVYSRLSTVRPFLQPFVDYDTNQVIAEAKQHRYIVGLRLTETTNSYCAGALIHSKFVVTAAHCLGSGIKWASIGSSYISGDDPTAERIRIARAVIHPDYNPDTLAYDVAVLQLERASVAPPIRFFTDVPLSSGVTLTLRGWGNLPGVREHERLQELSVRISTPNECHFKALEGMCAWAPQGVPLPCVFDEGTPLVAPDASGAWTLMAIGIQGTQFCKQKDAMAAFLRLDNIRFWILAKVMDGVAKA